MKKLTAIILSIIMLVSVMPVAFAADEECEHWFNNIIGERPNISEDGYCHCYKCGVKGADFSEVIEVWIEAVGIYYSVYDSEIAFERAHDVYSSVDEFIRRPIDEESEYVRVDYLTAEDQSVVDEIVEKSRKFIADFKNENYLVIFDAYEYAYYYTWAVTAIRGEGIKFEFSKDFEKNFDESPFVYDELIYEIRNGEKEVVAEDCIEKGENITFLFKNVRDCIFGNHRWGEYTENADGSKTANCTCCVATDTVEAENKDIFDILATDLVELVKMLIALIKSFAETVFA